MNEGEDIQIIIRKIEVGPRSEAASRLETLTSFLRDY
jgi:hypothetical protein